MTQADAKTASALYCMRAVTFVHAGIGQAQGVIDLPVAREAATDYPYVPGSGFKGALKTAARSHLGKDARDVKELFGENDAGQLLIGDVRLLLLPVRTLAGSFAWVTCHALLARFARDVRRTGVGLFDFSHSPAPGKALLLSGHPAESGSKIFLEEFSFSVEKKVTIAEETLATLARATLGDTAETTKRLVVLDDSDFAYFARHALPIRTRNALDPDTKTVAGGEDAGALWSEESLPPETILYSCLLARDPNDADPIVRIEALVAEKLKGFIQIGGNETVGEGWLEARRFGAAT